MWRLEGRKIILSPQWGFLYIFILNQGPDRRPTTVDYSCQSVIMGVMASQITSLSIVYSTVYSSADQRKHQSSASLAFIRGIYQWQVNSPHKWPVMQKMFPFDDVIMFSLITKIIVNIPQFDCLCMLCRSIVGDFPQSCYVVSSQSFRHNWPFVRGIHRAFSSLTNGK